MSIYDVHVKSYGQHDAEVMQNIHCSTVLGLCSQHGTGIPPHILLAFGPQSRETSFARGMNGRVISETIYVRYTRGCPRAQKNELGRGSIAVCSNLGEHRRCKLRCKTTVVSNLRMPGRLNCELDYMHFGDISLAQNGR